ncbi:MAG: HAMP domain-containing sensor histidine kinase [Sphingomicrobium sp.]
MHKREPAGVTAGPSGASEDADLALTWSRRWTLAHRILTLNLLTVVLVALSTLYLDVFRNRLSTERVHQTRIQATTTAEALAHMPEKQWPSVLAAISRSNGNRLRLYGPDGRLRVDSWQLTGPTYQLLDPKTEGFTRHAARLLDRGFNAIVGASPLDDYAEPRSDSLQAWPEAIAANAMQKSVTLVRNAPDLTPVVSAAVPVHGSVLLATNNDRAFTRTVHNQRGAIAAAMALIVLLSILLSRFMVRTIVRPLRHLAIAAHRVRLGRSREVRIPRLPNRSDEIGQLARAISDMSQSLRQRIDNIESFAADVTHELKNPLASLRSALDGAERVDDPAIRQQLLALARDDVARLDRLINDIGEAARTDGELLRADFELVDLGALIRKVVESWVARRETGSARVSFSEPSGSPILVMGKAGRLARAINAIVDNAISFSPADGLVRVSAEHRSDEVRITIDDEGPGVPSEAREAIFNRFHSVRPEGENFGRHSGLGLAIAQAIVEGHDGEIDVQNRDDAPSGARFTIRLPAADRQ